MTHFYELWKRVPRGRRIELAQFIHRLKCMCGRGWHLHVKTNLGEPCYIGGNDGMHFGNVCICNVDKLDDAAVKAFRSGIFMLMDEFGIPRRNFRYENDTEYVEEGVYVIDLYTDFSK